MPNRPAISAEVSRQVFIEAGHRCAVCGADLPLERAHIVPWCDTQDHSLENLICLCANCHQRADSEKWGEKVLKAYKLEPWVMRRGNPDLGSQLGITTKLQLTIDMELKDYDEKLERWIKHGIAGFLEISPTAVRIISKEEGSLKVTIELSPADAKRLLGAYERDDPGLAEYLSPLILLDLQPEVESEPTGRGSDRLSMQLKNIHDVGMLIRYAFTDTSLYRFLSYRPEFMPVLERIGPGASLDQMVDELISYCQERLLLAELLAAVEQSNPKQYARHRSRLFPHEVEDNIDWEEDT